MAERFNGRLSDTTLTLYHQFKAQQGLTGRGSDDQCMRLLLQPSQSVQSTPTPEELTPDMVLNKLACTDEEQQEIQAVLALPQVNFWTMLRTGLLREVRSRTTRLAKLDPATVNGSHPAEPVLCEDGMMRSPNRQWGSALLRVHQTVEDLMAQNLAATTSMDVLYITRGMVSDLSRTHSKYAKAYFEEHAAELQAHHQSVGIGSPQAGITHNRLRATHRRKQAWEGHADKDTAE